MNIDVNFGARQYGGYRHSSYRITVTADDEYLEEDVYAISEDPRSPSRREVSRLLLGSKCTTRIKARYDSTSIAEPGEVISKNMLRQILESFDFISWNRTEWDRAIRAISKRYRESELEKTRSDPATMLRVRFDQLHGSRQTAGSFSLPRGIARRLGQALLKVADGRVEPAEVVVRVKSNKPVV